MNVWIDAQLSPALASWFLASLGIHATPVRATKDSDFVRLLERHGPPPQVAWLTCGNTSNAALTEILTNRWPTVQEMLGAGEALVEICGPPNPS